MNLFERYEKLKSRALRLMENGNISGYLAALMELNKVEKQIHWLKLSN